MNEIETKINSRNPVLIGQVISRLLEAIAKKYNNDLKQVPEYEYLSKKCTVDDKCISSVASRAVITLVETKVLSCKSVLDDFIAKIYENGFDSSA